MCLEHSVQEHTSTCFNKGHHHLHIVAKAQHKQATSSLHHSVASMHFVATCTTKALCFIITLHNIMTRHLHKHQHTIVQASIIKTSLQQATTNKQAMHIASKAHCNISKVTKAQHTMHKATTKHLLHCTTLHHHFDATSNMQAKQGTLQHHHHHQSNNKAKRQQQ